MADLLCPVCATINLEEFMVGNDKLEKCPKCHGFWFSGDELADVEDLPDSDLMSDFQDQLDAGEIAQTKESLQNRKCPVCQAPMDSHQYDLSSGIWVQACHEGHGVWLDKGEVLKIHKHLLDTAKELTPEKLAALQMQLKQIEVDEKRQEENSVLSVFGHHEGSKIPVPAWHLMDGVTRFLYHSLFKLNV